MWLSFPGPYISKASEFGVVQRIVSPVINPLIKIINIVALLLVPLL